MVNKWLGLIVDRTKPVFIPNGRTESALVKRARYTKLISELMADRQARKVKEIVFVVGAGANWVRGWLAENAIKDGRKWVLK